jgi:hypothetical protein
MKNASNNRIPELKRIISKKGHKKKITYFHNLTDPKACLKAEFFNFKITNKEMYEDN